jgi:flagellin-like protein
MIKKRAVSPVIATVLLIMIVIVLALIILLWSRGFVKEAITKKIGDTEKTVEQYCGEVTLQPIVHEGAEGDSRCFGFQNIGTVPIYKFKIKATITNSGETTNIDGNEPVNPGFSVLIKDEVGDCNDYNQYEDVKVIPILLGTKKSGTAEPFECPENNAVSI